MIRPLERGSIKSDKKGSIKSVQRDSIKPAQGDSTKTAQSKSSKHVGSGSSGCSVQNMVQMPKLHRDNSVKKLASLSSENGSGSPVTSKLSDSVVLLAQRPTLVHTDITRPGRARLKEDKLANAGHDDNCIDVESHDVQSLHCHCRVIFGSNANTGLIRGAE